MEQETTYANPWLERRNKAETSTIDDTDFMNMLEELENRQSLSDKAFYLFFCSPIAPDNNNKSRYGLLP